MSIVDRRSSYDINLEVFITTESGDGSPPSLSLCVICRHRVIPSLPFADQEPEANSAL